MRSVPWLAALALLAPAAAHAEKFTIDEDTFLNIGLLFQPQITVAENGTPSGDVSTDAFIRRARLILTGQVDPRIAFVFITDQANWGRNGDYSAQFIVQDAVAIYKVAPEFAIDAGFMLLPFIRNSITSASSLNTIDYRIPVIRFLPSGRAFRDMGVGAHGLLANDKIYYRVGVFNGVAGRAAAGMTPEVNRKDRPRVTGTVRYNIFGKDDAYAFPGIYFAKEPVVSVGLAADYQEDALGTGTDGRRYLAYAADAFADYPLDPDNEIVASASVIRYDGYPGVSARDSALAWYFEGGYRWKQIEPTFSVEYFNSTGPLAAGSSSSRLITYRAGFNYWISKHAYNVKAELAIPQPQQVDGEPDVPNDLVGTLQVQTVF